jgi:chromosome segregation ATPase
MLGWLMLNLILLIVLAWDSSAKWAALQHSVEALACRLDDMEERSIEAQRQQRRDEVDMQETQESISRLTSKTSALQHRVETLTARLEQLKGPAGERENPKVRKAVDAFMSSFRA